MFYDPIVSTGKTTISVFPEYENLSWFFRDYTYQLVPYNREKLVNFSPNLGFRMHQPQEGYVYFGEILEKIYRLNSQWLCTSGPNEPKPVKKWQRLLSHFGIKDGINWEGLGNHLNSNTSSVQFRDITLEMVSSRMTSEDTLNVRSCYYNNSTHGEAFKKLLDYRAHTLRGFSDDHKFLPLFRAWVLLYENGLVMWNYYNRASSSMNKSDYEDHSADNLYLTHVGTWVGHMLNMPVMFVDSELPFDVYENPAGDDAAKKAKVGRNDNLLLEKRDTKRVHMISTDITYGFSRFGESSVGIRCAEKYVVRTPEGRIPVNRAEEYELCDEHNLYFEKSKGCYLCNGYVETRDGYVLREHVLSFKGGDYLNPDFSSEYPHVLSPSLGWDLVLKEYNLSTHLTYRVRIDGVEGMSAVVDGLTLSDGYIFTDEEPDFMFGQYGLMKGTNVYFRGIGNVRVPVTNVTLNGGTPNEQVIDWEDRFIDSVTMRSGEVVVELNYNVVFQALMN